MTCGHNKKYARAPVRDKKQGVNNLKISINMTQTYFKVSDMLQLQAKQEGYINEEGVIKKQTTDKRSV